MSAEATIETVASVARTAGNYDQLPYESRAFAQSQPSRLGAIARVFGLDAAPLGTARVLELGCASGGNLIPHAALYPDARFVGIDLSPAQIEAGCGRIARLGLSNIELRCRNLAEIGDELGSFDYIICHGVYSWVPAAVRDAIFPIIRARLSSVGVACVSYNVLPGWRMRQPLHDAFMLDVPDNGDLPGRVARARELLDFLAAATPDQGPYGDTLRSRAALMATQPDDYVAHEFLEEANHPSTVRAFATQAARDGLGFLGECELVFSIPEYYGPEVARQVRARAKDDRLETEQYLDLLTGRTFRQTILVSSERLATASRAIAPESIAPLHFLADAGMRLDWDGAEHIVTDAAGRALSTGFAAAEGIAWLIAGFPSSSSLDECARAITGDQEAGRAHLLDALHRMVLAGMVTLSSEPVRAGRGDVAKPRAIALARADAADGAQATTNLRHEPVALNAAACALLPVMDGNRDRAALAKRLEEAVLAGRVAFALDGNPVTDPDAIRDIAAQGLPALLAGLANAGLLER
uniref:methyltransferase regulatory domain-containing protein n=1 Tax=Sphingomonas bacterium TaxID=1895847 RepID=UPI002635E16C|nr:class I SAM-dependent methyltransferase [Sphingomonas bacterium]